MTPDERELRRALAERIGRPAPDFGDRASHTLSKEKRAPNYLPALALSIATVLTISTIGVLLISRQEPRTAQLPVSTTVPGAISTPSPRPCCWPYAATLVV